MTGFPQEQTFVGTHRTSVSCQELTNVVQQRASSFDNSVGALLKEQRHIETERFCNLEIDRQLELDRGLDREIGWLCATENAIDILAAQ
jgi:hypothetical protein